MTSEWRISTGPSITSWAAASVTRATFDESSLADCLTSVFCSTCSSSGCSRFCSSLCCCLFLFLPPDFCLPREILDQSQREDRTQEPHSRRVGNYITQNRHDARCQPLTNSFFIPHCRRRLQPPVIKEKPASACRLIASRLSISQPCFFFLGFLTHKKCTPAFYDMYICTRLASKKREHIFWWRERTRCAAHLCSPHLYLFTEWLLHCVRVCAARVQKYQNSHFDLNLIVRLSRTTLPALILKTRHLERNKVVTFICALIQEILKMQEGASCLTHAITLSATARTSIQTTLSVDIVKNSKNSAEVKREILNLVFPRAHCLLEDIVLRPHMYYSDKRPQCGGTRCLLLLPCFSCACCLASVRIEIHCPTDGRPVLLSRRPLLNGHQPK